MTVHRTLRTGSTHPDTAESLGGTMTTTAARAMAVLRMATGFVFLWAFLDKTFGLAYATPSAKAWIHGGSPTKGFLNAVQVGPFQTAFHAIAGAAWADWLFMLGMLGVGSALALGIALRTSAVAGVLVLTMMWIAEFPPAQHLADGSASGSTNPLVDYHIVYAIVLIVLATTYSGSTWGLGRMWAALPFVQHNHWAL